MAPSPWPAFTTKTNRVMSCSTQVKYFHLLPYGIFSRPCLQLLHQHSSLFVQRVSDKEGENVL
jgi:hypothetical protein